MTDSTAITTTYVAQPGVFSSAIAFDEAQRFAKALASSTLVPQQYQGQQGLGNCIVALGFARRMNIDPLMVVQNLHVIHGRPSWSSQFIIGLINGCGRFSLLRYEITGKGETLACTAVATDLASGQELRGPEVTMTMAKKEGWATKSNSKWLTMPELMIRYRAAAFWGRLYASDMLLGIQSQEEVVDIQPVSVSESPATSVADLNAAIAKPAPEPAPALEPIPAADDDELF